MPETIKSITKAWDSINDHSKPLTWPNKITMGGGFALLMAYCVDHLVNIHEQISKEQIAALESLVVDKSINVSLDAESLMPFLEGKLTLNSKLGKNALADAGIVKGKVTFVFTGTNEKDETVRCSVDAGPALAESFFELSKQFAPHMVIDKNGRLLASENPLVSVEQLKKLCQMLPEKIGSHSPGYTLFDIWRVGPLAEVTQSSTKTPN